MRILLYELKKLYNWRILALIAVMDVFVFERSTTFLTIRKNLPMFQTRIKLHSSNNEISLLMEVRSIL